MNTTTLAPTTIGSFECVTLPELQIKDAIAKVDTGAYSGAVHCSSIRLIKRKSDGVKILRFVPSDNHPHVIETEHFSIVDVKSSNGHTAKRYLIETEMIVRDKSYMVNIGLSNRSTMHREVLIGRRFLRENNILVDVRINQELDNDSKGKI
jgi:hypothetical protein